MKVLYKYFRKKKSPIFKEKIIINKTNRIFQSWIKFKKVKIKKVNIHKIYRENLKKRIIDFFFKKEKKNYSKSSY